MDCRGKVLVPPFVAAACLLATSVVERPISARSARSCPAPPRPLSFAKQTYVDMTRAGGEPSVDMHPDGMLLYGAHAGTTHFYTPTVADEDSAAFFQNYRGQAYYWYSKNNGKTWRFSDRTLPPSGVPGSGFSDPDFAIDTAGQVYISEINLANIAVSKSTDSGQSYELQNFFGMVLTDRQWKAADQKDVLYMVGNAFAGGTFPSDPSATAATSSSSPKTAAPLSARRSRIPEGSATSWSTSATERCTRRIWEETDNRRDSSCTRFAVRARTSSCYGAPLGSARVLGPIEVAFALEGT